MAGLLCLAAIPLFGPSLENPLARAGAIADINAAAWLQIWVTWWAGLAVLGYSYLTYSQREVQRRDVELSAQNLRVANAQLGQTLRPYLELGYVRLHGNLGGQSIAVRNIGKAVAIGVSLRPLDAEDPDGTAHFEFKIVGALPPDGEWVEVPFSGATSHTFQDKATFWVWAYILTKHAPVVSVSYQGPGHDYERWDYEAKFQYDDGATGGFRDVEQTALGVG